ATHSTGGDTHEFCWLFEYGLEMDPATLNTSERLNGLALLYGKAALNGYRLLLGSIEDSERREEGLKTIATIVPDATPGAQVWGVLYRIPKRLTDRRGGSPSALDSAHAMTSTQGIFQQLRIVVRDVQHDRELSCITYVATERVRQQFAPVPIHLSREPLFMQRLSALARRHKFPEYYLREEQAVMSRPSPYITGTSATVSHDTDPLPVMTEQRKPPMLTNTLPETPLVSSPATIPAPLMTPAALPRPGRLLIVFSSYLVALLVLAISFAVLQGTGVWSSVLNDHFVPMNVPWMVMLYGLLGGCVSSLVTLERYRARHLAAFVLLTWFTRPFVGSLLAAFSYLILTSGIFMLDASPVHMPVFLLTGALAGLCESVVLFKRK
ncbi:MAG TPA: gamma-glutamylcyclotransferase family protein, partial [Ktedonobacteraceae bacterium]